MTLAKQKNLESIQALRGLAAILVMLFHYSGPLNLNPENKLAIVLSHGWSGVDMFFIISGFIAAYTVSINDKGYKESINYLVKRILRIIPLYYIVTILSVGNSFESFTETAKSLLFIPIGGLPPDGLGPIYGGARIGQGWTLNYEMYFYLVVSISILFGRAKWLFTSAFIALSVFAPLILFSIPESYGFQGFYFNYSYINLMTNPLVLEFIIGVFIFFFYKKMSNKFSLLWGAFILFSILIFSINLYSPFYFTSRITAWGAPSALLIIALLKIEKMKIYRFPRVFLHIGNISFSIYLLHESIENMLLKIFKHASGNENIFSDINARFLLFSLSILITLSISNLSCKYIEKSFSNWLKIKILPAKIKDKKQPV